MTTSADDRAERLRRLAEQRAVGASAQTGRRRHAAAAARVLAAGLSGSGFLFGVAALAAKPVTWTEPTGASAEVPDPAPPPAPAPVEPVTPITVVVERRHRTVYVDGRGNPVDPASLSLAPPQPSARPARTRPTAPVARPAVTGGPVAPPQTGTAGHSGGDSGECDSDNPGNDESRHPHDGDDRPSPSPSPAAALQRLEVPVRPAATTTGSNGM